MTIDALDRKDIAKALADITEHLVEIAEVIDRELCSAITQDCETDWETDRGKVTKAFQKIIPKHSISNRLPTNELGLIALEALSSLVKIGGGYQRIFLMIDMLRDVEFDAIFMDSLSSISSKVYDAVVSLKNMAYSFPEDPNSITECSETITRIEREVDEEHIIICRQISVATEGHPDYVVYLMRKIVGELETITDNLLDFAETVEGW
jgi:hypothetical protein